MTIKYSTAPVIREALQSERQTLAELTKAAYAEYAAVSDPKFWIQYEAATERTILHDDAPIRLIAEVDKRPVGTVLFCPPYELKLGDRIVKNIYPEVRLLAVLPNFREYGIGAKLIDECENRARRAEYPALTLHTTTLMQTARRMYEKRGYLRYPELDFEPTAGFIVYGYKKEL
jgi:GNAT superfamily N-acetyltransferase